MNKPKFFRGRPIIQPGEVYEIEGINYKILTATSSIIGENNEGLAMTEPIFWLENIETKKRRYMKRSVLESKFKEETTKYGS